MEGERPIHKKNEIISDNMDGIMLHGISQI